MPPVYEIEFIGRAVSKKNFKKTFLTKSGKMCATYGSAQVELDRLSMQIPPEVRDLGLVHPDIEFFFTVTDGRSDRDNGVTTLMDILVSYGVIRNDSVGSCNGRVVINPATRGPVAMTRVVLTDTGINHWPEGPKARHPRRLP